MSGGDWPASGRHGPGGAEQGRDWRDDAPDRADGQQRYLGGYPDDGYLPSADYSEQGRPGAVTGYGDPAGYGDGTGYAGYGDRGGVTGYDGQGSHGGQVGYGGADTYAAQGYGGSAGYGDGADYANGAGYGGQAGYGSQAGYGGQAGYGDGGYGDGGRHRDDGQADGGAAGYGGYDGAAGYDGGYPQEARQGGGGGYPDNAGYPDGAGYGDGAGYDHEQDAYAAQAPGQDIRDPYRQTGHIEGYGSPAVQGWDGLGRHSAGPGHELDADATSAYQMPGQRDHQTGSRSYDQAAAAPDDWADSGSFDLADSGSFGRPDTGSFGRPDTGSFDRPDTGSFGRPDTGSLDRPDTGSFGRPDTGSLGRPGTGSFDPADSGQFDQAAFDPADSASFDRPDGWFGAAAAASGSNGHGRYDGPDADDQPSGTFQALPPALTSARQDRSEPGPAVSTGYPPWHDEQEEKPIWDPPEEDDDWEDDADGGLLSRRFGRGSRGDQAGRGDQGERAGGGRRGSGGNGGGKGKRRGQGGRPRRARGRVAFTISLIAVLVIVGGAVGLGLKYGHAYIESRYGDYSGPGTGNVNVTVPAGATLEQLGPTLVKDGVIMTERPYDTAAGKAKNASTLQPGVYRLHHHMNAALAVQLLLGGQTRLADQFRVVEGERASNIAGQLAKLTHLPQSQFTQLIAHPPASLGLPSWAGPTAEGFLFPDTYSLLPHQSAADSLKQLVTDFNQRVAPLDLPGAAAKVYTTPYHVLIVASLIQAEGNATDFAQVSRVIWNRLKINMLLEFDSTVFYAMGTYGTSISKAQESFASPYNTYLHTGLPPGPIGSPSLAAIQAALHPAAGPWLYFITDVKSPTHKTYFTASLTQLQQWQQQFGELNQADRRSIRAAVLGSPVGHSLSPLLHAAAYEALGLTWWRYAAIECDEAGLGALLDSCGPDWAGLSLTMPLKRTVLPLLDRIDPLAAEVGGANTVVFAAAQRLGYNTDVPGMVRALAEHGVGTAAAVGPAAIIGGGATACAALAALRDLGERSAAIAIRDRARATEIGTAADRLGMAIELVPIDPVALAGARLVISTVPAAGADVVAQLIPALIPAPAVVFDVVYDPWPTPVAAAARQAGARVVGGFDLLLHQAALQVELMTDRPAPVERMRQAGLAELARRATARPD